MPWAFVCPSSRGIGLHLSRQILQATKLNVVATARSNIEAARCTILDGLDVDKNRLEVVQLDVTDEESVMQAASQCKHRFESTYLHLAFCVPGVLYPERSPSQIDYDHALHTFRINALGPLLLMKHFASFLPRKTTPIEYDDTLPSLATFTMMSARVGSITDNSLGGWYSYRGSKAAVNQIVKSLDIHLKNNSGDRAMSVALHPGTVKTSLSKEFWNSTPKEKLFEPQFAAERLFNVVRGLRSSDRGGCFDWQGKLIPP